MKIRAGDVKLPIKMVGKTAGKPRMCSCTAQSGLTIVSFFRILFFIWIRNWNFQKTIVILQRTSRQRYSSRNMLRLLLLAALMRSSSCANSPTYVGSDTRPLSLLAAASRRKPRNRCRESAPLLSPVSIHRARPMHPW